jgi:hypothetical protein
MLKKLVLLGATAVLLSVAVLLVAKRPDSNVVKDADVAEDDGRVNGMNYAKPGSLPSLDARGFAGVYEITRPELVRLMSKFKALSPEETGQLDRGCLGLVCLYQGIGLKRWPELARSTVAYLDVADALKRRCPEGRENFVFVKQGWWLGGAAPAPSPRAAPISVESVTRIRPGGFTFNYAAYFPSTATYAWINHRDYGFPLNLVKPQKAYLSVSPPPLGDTRTAQIFCSTCR